MTSLLDLRAIVRRLAALLLAFAATPLLAGDLTEFDVTLDSLPASITVDNPGAADRPAIYIVGQPEVPSAGAADVRPVSGVSLNGVRLTERMLSGSVLILHPGGGAHWGYNTGFDLIPEPMFKDGQRVDPRSLVEYGKVRYDPLDPVSVTGSDINLLLLYNNRPLTPLRYEVAFPDPMRIRTFRVRGASDQIGRARVTVTLYADEARQQVIASQTIGAEQGRFPIEFKELDTNRVFFEMSAEADAGLVGFYSLQLEAELDTADLAVPTLTPGENTIHVAADDDASPHVRLVMRWLANKPGPEQIFDDFETGSRWGASLTPVAGNGQQGYAFSGDGFARIRFAADGSNHSVGRYAGLGVNLSQHNRIGLAIRAVDPAPMSVIQFGFRNGDGAWQWVRRLRADQQWTYQTFDISHIDRDNITGFLLYFGATPGTHRPDRPCIYDIDALSFFHEAETTEPTADPLPEHVAHHRSPYTDASPSKREIPPLQEWFPLGVYDGIMGRSRQEAIWLLDAMKRHHMNSLYIANGRLSESENLISLDELLTLAEQRGIRLIYQGGSCAALFYHGPTAEARHRCFENNIRPAAEQWIPRFDGRWGLAAWSLTEEIRPELSRELADYYALVRSLSEQHPPTVLHNNLNAAEVDLKTNRPLVITHDRYPFFWNPRSGPSTPTRSLAYYQRGLEDYYALTQAHDARLWMMPQAWAGVEQVLDPPHYGAVHGMRQPEPGEIKLQGWLAVAHGATGIMFYAAVPSDPGTHHLWDYGYQETANTRAAGELFANLARVAPLLVRLERDFVDAGFVRVTAGDAVAHSFVKRSAYAGDRPGRYVILASLDGFGPQDISLKIDTSDRVYDLLADRDVTDQLDAIRLAAGEGRIFYIGDRHGYDADRQMIAEQRRRYAGEAD